MWHPLRTYTMSTSHRKSQLLEAFLWEKEIKDFYIIERIEGKGRMVKVEGSEKKKTQEH